MIPIHMGLINGFILELKISANTIKNTDWS